MSLDFKSWMEAIAVGGSAPAGYQVWGANSDKMKKKMKKEAIAVGGSAPAGYQVWGANSDKMKKKMKKGDVH